MTVCDVDLSTPGKIKLTTPTGKTLGIGYDQTVWTVTIDRPSMTGPEFSSFASKWNDRPIQRILLSARSPQAKHSLEYVINIS